MTDAQVARPKLWQTVRELPRPVHVLLIGVAVNRMGSLVPIFIILYLTSIGFSPSRAGLALTTYGFGCILGVFASGTMSDRIGPKPTIIISMLSSAVLVTALAQIHNFAVLLPICLCAGGVAQLYRPAALAILAELTSPERLVITSAAFRLGLNVGATAAPLLGVILANDSYTAVFMADAATSLTFALVAIFALPGAQSKRMSIQHSGNSGATGYLALRHDHRFLIVIVAMFATALAEIQTQSVLPLQTTQRGLPTTLYATVLAINGAMVIALELPLTPLVQKLPIRASIASGSALIGLGISLFGLPGEEWLPIVAAIIWTTGEIVSAPSISAYPALVASAELRGRYIGALSTSQALGYALGPVVGTNLYQLAGSRMWIMCLLLGTVAGIGMWRGITEPATQNSSPT